MKFEDESLNAPAGDILPLLHRQMLRIEEQLAQLAQLAIDTCDKPARDAEYTLERSGHKSVLLNGEQDRSKCHRSVRPPLPDPRLVRSLLRQRQARARFLGTELFSDPAWDMLLDLTAAREEHVRVSVTSLCIASGVPPTTALRWISVMCEAGLLKRENDEIDRRRAFITLTDRAADAMASFFAECGAARLV